MKYFKNEFEILSYLCSSTWLETTVNEESFQNRWLKHDVRIVRLQINDFFSKISLFLYRFLWFEKKKKQLTLQTTFVDQKLHEVDREKERKKIYFQSLNHYMTARSPEKKKTFITFLLQGRTTPFPGRRQVLNFENVVFFHLQVFI